MRQAAEQRVVVVKIAEAPKCMLHILHCQRHAYHLRHQNQCCHQKSAVLSVYMLVVLLLLLWVLLFLLVGRF